MEDAVETKTSELTIDVEEPKGWARRLTITVPAGRVEKERASVASRIRSRVRLPGFRKGRVPESVVNRQFGDAIQSETVERIVDAAYREALREKGMQPITQGEVDGVEYEPGADLTFSVRFEVRPEIEIARTGGFAVERPPSEVAEEDVERVLSRLRSEHAEWTAAESGKPTPGDRVTVEITPVKEGEEPKPRRYQIVVGEGQAISDVESAIQTLEVGGSGEFVISLAGGEEAEGEEQQRVRIELFELEQPELPELDDAFARHLGDFEGADDLRVKVREDLQREANAEAEAQVRRALVDRIIEANAFDVPDAMVRQYVDGLFPRGKDTPAEKVSEMYQMAWPAAERAIRRSLVVERVAEMESLRPSAEEVDARVEEIAERAGRPVGEVWAQLQKSGRLDRLENEILEEKVFDFLKSKSEIRIAGGGAQSPASETPRGRKK